MPLKKAVLVIPSKAVEACWGYNDDAGLFLVVAVSSNSGSISLKVVLLDEDKFQAVKEPILETPLKRIRLMLTMQCLVIASLFWPNVIDQMLQDFAEAEEKREQDRFIGAFTSTNTKRY